MPKTRNNCAFLLLLLLFTASLQAQKTFKNPILSGFHPDPSLCRVGDDYYMITSSFEWFPGIPIFHSKDLVNWEQLGHVLNRPSQLQMRDGLKASNGLWAPTIRYHNGMFYVICTATGCGGNFFVTAKNPQGPYSEPIFIKEAPGIDPSLFFDDDNKVWYCGSINGDNKIPPRQYPAEDRIYVQQINLTNGEFVGERYIVTSGYAINSPYGEAPHIYKINGKYYLMIAEGGTWENHAVTVFTADKVNGPYTPFVCNPVLTHRHLGNDIDITTIGHADWVQTQNGDWYAVMLGVRPVDGFNMLGRETFLTSVKFQGEQPVFNPGVGRVLMEDKFPNLSEAQVEAPPSRDEFTGETLSHCWNFLRTPFECWYSLQKGKLWLNLRPNKLTEFTNPSLIALRIQHHQFQTIAAMQLTTLGAGEEAGVVIMQNDRFHYRLVIVGRDKKDPQQLRLIRIKAGEEQVVASIPYKEKKIVLGIRGEGLQYSFVYGDSEATLHPLAVPQDATICSSNIARGFIGPYIGMYGSSNGQKSSNKVAFDWFEYVGK